MGKRGGAAKLLARLLVTEEVPGLNLGMAPRKNYSLCNKDEDKRKGPMHDRALPVKKSKVLICGLGVHCT
jgi:hypothetical protein